MLQVKVLFVQVLVLEWVLVWALLRVKVLRLGRVLRLVKAMALVLWWALAKVMVGLRG
jgi:hypothetical protein